MAHVSHGLSLWQPPTITPPNPKKNPGSYDDFAARFRTGAPGASTRPWQALRIGPYNGKGPRCRNQDHMQLLKATIGPGFLKVIVFFLKIILVTSDDSNRKMNGNRNSTQSCGHDPWTLRSQQRHRRTRCPSIAAASLGSRCTPCNCSKPGPWAFRLKFRCHA